MSELSKAALAVLEYGLALNVNNAMKARTGEDQPLSVCAVHPLLQARVLHLMRMEQWLKDGRHLRLSADEALGLESLRGARLQFEAAHPSCPHCGAPQRGGDTLCWRCWRSPDEVAA